MTNSMALGTRTGMDSMDRQAVLRRLPDLPYIFIAGGLIGTVYEFLLALFSTGQLQDRTGSILTPFNYVYGTGAVVMFVVLFRLKKPGVLFSVGCLLGGAVEFFLSLGQELLLGTTSWDYSSKPLNIGGRTTLPYMLVWGVLCVVAMKLIFPLLLKAIGKIPQNAKKVGAMVIVCVMCLDAVVTFTAVFRYAQRADGVAASGPVLEAVDVLFHDRFMQTHFPNMSFPEIRQNGNTKTNHLEERSMAKSKLVKANEKIAEGVTSGFQKMSDGVTSGFQKMSDGVVGAYRKIEDGFVDRYLTRDGESIGDAKARLQAETAARQEEARKAAEKGSVDVHKTL